MRNGGGQSLHDVEKKNIPELGVLAVDYHAQHKNHLHKCMYQTTTVIVLKVNDITKGGKALIIANVRVGHMEQCKKDTYKLVYNDEGDFTISKILENRLQRKGDMTWANLDITSSKDKKDRKINMLEIKV
eukprot:13819271-Ditylum_brightwellii.AAC.1